MITFCRHAVLAVCCIVPVTAQAQTVVSTTTTFDGVTVPYPAGTLNIDGIGTPTLFMLNGATLGGITTLSIGSVQSGALYLSGSSTLTNSGSSEIGTDIGSVGVATISGANSLWQMTGNLTAGQFGGTGRITITDGGSLVVGGTLKLWNNSTLTIGNGGHVTTQNFDKSQGKLTLNDGTLTISGGVYTHYWDTDDFNNAIILNGSITSTAPNFELSIGATTVNVEATVIGSTGHGRLLITGGSTLTSTGSSWVLGAIAGQSVSRGSGYLALAAGSTGTATITGTGSRWSLTSSLYVGDSGIGVMSVEDGGKVASHSGYLGDESTGNGTATITGVNSLWSLTGSLYIGDSGIGALHVHDGGNIRSNIGYLGYGLSGNGTATITGTGSRWSLSNHLNVGYSGTGALNVQSGGNLTSNLGRLGFNSGAVGVAMISGTGSLLSITSDLNIGYSGNGALNVHNSGNVTSSVGVLGFNSSGVGVATISGVGSLLSITSSLNVGYSGTGALNVQNGGNVTSNLGTLGLNPNSNGTATITGTNSLWSITNFLDVGLFGTGALNVQHAGNVSSKFGVIGNAATGNGAATISGADSVLSLTDYLFVGSFGSGALNVQAGGNVTSRTGYVGANSGSIGAVVISGSNSQWSVTENLYLAGRETTAGGPGSLTVTDGGSLVVGGTLKLWSNGTLTIGSGGHVTARNFDKSVGTLALNDGTFTVSGGVFTHTLGTGKANNILVVNGAMPTDVPTLELASGATAVGVEALVIGSTGQGRLILAGGAVLSTVGTVTNLGSIAGYSVARGQVFLGLAPGSNGTASITGAGSQWIMSQELNIGFSGNGALTISGGGHVVTKNVSLGDKPSGVGSVVVSGTGTELLLTDTFGGLIVGRHGRGRLTIDSGAIVSSYYGYIGYNHTSLAEVVVSGSGTLWTTTHRLVLREGNATLTIADGARVVTGATAGLSAEVDASSLVTVTGVNSEWIIANNLVVAASGTASVVVAGGGRLVSLSSQIALDSGSRGSVLITGSESRWTLTSSISIGFGGAGTLTVSDGATVSASFVGLAGPSAATTGTLTISGLGTSFSISDRLHVGTTLLNDAVASTLVSASASLRVGNTLRISNAGTLTIDGGSVLVRNLDRSLGALNFNTGTLTVSGGVYTHTTGSGQANNILTLNGNTPSAVPTFELSNGATAVSVEATVIGSTGQGRLLISGGSVFTNTGSSISLSTIAGQTINRGNGYVGLAAGSTGTVTISGAGSQWLLMNGLYLGGNASASGGFGSLTVTDGGTVTVGGLTKIWQQGELHIGNGGTLQTGTLEIMPGGKFTLDAGGTFLGGSFLGSTNLAVSGTFVANGAVPGQVVVGSGGTLKGGTVGNPGGAAAVGAIVVNSGGTLSPGNSIGQLNVSGADVPGGASITLNAASNVVFEFKNALGATPGTDWDLLDLGTGILDLGTAGITPGVDQIKLYIDPWLADNSGHGTNNFTPANDYEWLFIKKSDLANLTGGVGGVTAANIADYFEIINDAPGQGLYGSGNPFTNAQRPSGSSRFGLAWMTTAQGSGLYLTYAAVPEPGSMILCGIAAGGFYLRRRRNKRRADVEPPATATLTSC